jgi:uncharacterized membrane protein
MIVAMTIAILRGHDGNEHNTHQNDITIITKAMMILILIVFTYSCSDSKKKLIMLKNNTNNLNRNSNILIVIHNVMTKIHYYNMSRTKKLFSRKAHKNIKRMNY